MVVLWRAVVSLLLLTLVGGGCRKDHASLAGPRPRLVVFSPALTKMLFQLGLGDHVVGVTTYCRLPEPERRPVVGNALNIRAEPILQVNPDVILSQIEPKHFEPVCKLRPEIRIETFHIETLADIAAAMQRVGEIAGDREAGLRASRRFQQQLEQIRQRSARLTPRRVLFVVGYQDPLGAGGGTFLDEMITAAGGENILAGHISGWKKPSLETIAQLAPDVVVCQCQAAEAEDAVRYWRTLGEGSFARQVVAVTDDDWTLPAGHLADYTAKLQEIIHGSPEFENAPP